MILTTAMINQLGEEYLPILFSCFVPNLIIESDLAIVKSLVGLAANIIIFTTDHNQAYYEKMMNSNTPVFFSSSDILHVINFFALA